MTWFFVAASWTELGRDFTFSQIAQKTLIRVFFNISSCILLFLGCLVVFFHLCSAFMLLVFLKCLATYSCSCTSVNEGLDEPVWMAGVACFLKASFLKGRAGHRFQSDWAILPAGFALQQQLGDAHTCQSKYWFGALCCVLPFGKETPTPSIPPPSCHVYCGGLGTRETLFCFSIEFQHP
jgi:hypothetical protein